MSYLAKHYRALVLGLLALVVTGLCQAGKPLELGQTAPDWILPNAEGQHISFYQDSQDHAAVILFWATWCPYCAELMPKLQDLQQELQGKKVKFYALNVWEEGDAPGYMAKHGYDFTLLLNADMVAKRYHVKGTPGLVVVDADKNLRYLRAKGTSADDAITMVKEALKVK